MRNWVAESNARRNNPAFRPPEHQRDLEQRARHDLHAQLAVGLDARGITRQLQGEHHRQNHRGQRLDRHVMHVHGQLVKRRIPRLRALRQHARGYRTGTTAPIMLSIATMKSSMPGSPIPQTGSAQGHGAEDLRRRDDHAAAHDLPQTRLRLRPVMVLQTAAKRHRAPHQPQAAANRRELHEQLQHGSSNPQPHSSAQERHGPPPCPRIRPSSCSPAESAADKLKVQLITGFWQDGSD